MANDYDVRVGLSLVNDLSKPLNDATSDLEGSFNKMNRGTREAEDGIKNLGTSIKGEFISVLKGMAVQLGIVASTGAFIAFLKDSVKESREWNIVQAQLTQALGHTSKALADQATSLQYLSIYQDDQIANAQKMAAGFGLTEAQILKLTPAVADLSSLMGQDIVSTMTLVTRLLANGGDDLKRYGISLDGATTEGERFSRLLTEIEGKAANQAKVLHDAQGGFGDLGKAVKDFQQGIGDALTDDLDDLGLALTGVIKNMSAFGEGMVNFILSPFRVVTSGLLGYVSTFEYLMAKVTGNKELTALSNATFAEAQAVAAKGFEWYKPAEKDVPASPTSKGDDTRNRRRDKEAAEFDFSGLPSQMNIKAADQDFKDTQDANKQALEEKQKNLEESKRLQDEFQQASIEAIPEQHARELALLEFKKEQELAIYGKSADDVAVIENKAAIRKAQIDAEDIDRKKKLKQVELQVELGAAQGILGAMGQVAEAGKASANVRKRIAQGSAIINTAQAITRAIAEYPPPLDIIMPLAFAAQGAAQIAMIEQQKFALGGDFVTSGPQLIMVGDNAGGRERVQVTPQSSQNVNGPKDGATMVFNFSNNDGSVETLRTAIRRRDADLLIVELKNRMALV